MFSWVHHKVGPPRSQQDVHTSTQAGPPPPPKPVISGCISTHLKLHHGQKLALGRRTQLTSTEKEHIGISVKHSDLRVDLTRAKDPPILAKSANIEIRAVKRTHECEHRTTFLPLCFRIISILDLSLEK